MFNHADKDWHWDMDAPYWTFETEKPRALEYLVRLFRSPGFLVQMFSPDQIGTGINYLVSNSCSDYAFLLRDDALDIEQQLEGLRSMHHLYRDVFATICKEIPQHGRRSLPDGCGEAEGICYMMWDVFPFHAFTKNEYCMDDPEIVRRRHEYLAYEDACLWAIEQTLQLPHIACQEGALHGLGEWHFGYPERTQAAIDAYLKTITPQHPLWNYAHDARTGCIL